MPKHGNIFTNWFKSSKQKHGKKAQQQYPLRNQSNADPAIEPAATAVKRSPLVPREPTNDSRSDLSPRSRRTSIFGLTFGLASSTGSSRLSLLSGNSKQAVQHKSTSCIETQCSFYDQQPAPQHQNGSILRKSSANVETGRENRENINPQPNAQYNNHSQPSRSPATPPRKQSKSGSITSVGFLQQLAAQLHPGRTSPRSPNTGSANSSLQNIASGGTTPTPPRSPTNQNAATTASTNQSNCPTTAASLTFHRNSSLKQTSVIFSSLDQGSAFTPISSFNTTGGSSTNAGTAQKPFLQRQATTQQQKQIQFQQQHHSNQSYSFQKIVEYNPANPPNIMSSSGLITTINESFTESNQDSSDAEIVEVFAGGEHSKSRTGTLDLVDEQLIFNGPEGDEKAKDNRRPCSPAPFNLTPNEKQPPDESGRKDSQPDKSPAAEDGTEFVIDKELPDRPVKKKTSFADESEPMDGGAMFPKCKLGHRDTLRDSLKDSLIDNLRESMNQGDDEGDGKALKRKSVDLNELGDSIDQQPDQQGAEETDSFGELVTNDEDFSLYENRTGLGDDLKFLASMPELCDITFLVGENREPVCAVSAVLGSRSRVFYKLLYGQKAYSNQQYSNNPDSDLPPEKPVVERSTRRSIFGGRKESIVEDSGTMNESKRGREESITGGLLRYSKSKKFKETKDTKLKLFLKRGSEPMLNGLPLHQQIQPPVHQTMIIEEFEPDVFRQLIEYIHTGCVTLQARTLLGLMNAADYYGLDELRKSCMGFVQQCITVDTVCALLASAERYIQYKCTKSLVQRVLEFVDNHGNEVLSLGSFALLPEHVVRLILSREELKAEELIKFQAALQWSQRYCDGSPGTADLREVMMGFFECIEFYKIPATVLMREVHPLNIVPDHIIMNALAYQADPKSIDIRKVESPNRFRRMTLPHALNIAGSEMLSNLHRQSLVPLKSERSASTSTSGYNTECSMFSANNTSSGNLGFSASIKRKKGERDEDGPSNENEESGTGKSKSKEKKDKEKDKQSKVGKRRGSRPFRRALTLFEGKGHHS